MKVVDKTDGEKVKKTEDDVSFMITNKAGGFCLLSNYPKSRFEGIFFRENDKIYKVIDSFRFEKPVTKVVNQLWTVGRERDGLIENFFMPLHTNAILYELSETAEFDLILDCRQIYDNRQWGRSYEITKEPNCIIIKFSKKNNDQENNSKVDDEFDIYLVVYSDDLEYRPMQIWEKMFYELDKERDSVPFEKYVYNACKLRCKNMVFAFSTNKKDALKEAKYVWRNKESLKKEKENHVSDIIHNKSIKSDDDTAVAYQCSLNALDSLIVGDEGISAGLPWFFQFWARDELISLKALLNLGEFSLAKKILLKYMDMIGPDGKVNDKDISPELSSADGTLWIFKRLDDFLEAVKKNGDGKKYFNGAERYMIREKLRTVISQWAKYHMQDGLIINGPKETWMDTEWKGDNREGARIEINALFLACLKLLGKIDKVDPLEKEIAKNVRKLLFTGNSISDGLFDPTIRPNVFIAAYVYPELFSKKEWINAFEKMLPKMWLSWGGLASIDKKNKLYVSQHTGEVPQSYHRGDSWFWINNLAAIVLHKLDRKKFKKYIDKILKASTNEMLYMGVTGYSAELSSAAELKSQGCMCQTWSSAMYIEMIDELYK